MNQIIKRKAVALAAIVLGIFNIQLTAADEPATSEIAVVKGPFEPTMQSLKQYQYPQWFRDAKFGIWAHWGPQAVPGEGDWYARQIYEQGSAKNKYHVEHYGHPSKFGYKDIIPLWKAEKWDPDRLMSLYKKAGAQYFVSMGTHHDNFFLWASKLHRWNSVEMGPRRDVVGEWQKAAQKYGLRFGVSEHLGASFTWFQGSHLSDKTGPLAGIAYDGADPANQDLYHFPAEPGDKDWYSRNPKWQKQWYSEIKELIDLYHPDLLYSDGGVPFGNDVGLSMIAHLYNTSAGDHNGTTEAVYNCKQPSEGKWVQDLERGNKSVVDPLVWQTDTSIGDWFYNRHWKYRPINWTVHTLVDNVSKNGNLLLNVVLRPDGSLEPEVEEQLNQLADWTTAQGEAIYGTRPWLVYGEGQNAKKTGMFSESDDKYTSGDIRFTTKNGALYAIAMGWPADGKVTIRSLAKAAGMIEGIALVGSSKTVTWEQTDEALVVTVPMDPVSKYTCALRIAGSNLKPVPVATSTTTTLNAAQPDKDGNINLAANMAVVYGEGAKIEYRSDKPNIGFWDKPADVVCWEANFPTAGKYRVTIHTATMSAETPLQVCIAGATLNGTVTPTTGWDDYKPVDLGIVTIAAPGIHSIVVKPASTESWHAINLRQVTLTPAK